MRDDPSLIALALFPAGLGLLLLGVLNALPVRRRRGYRVASAALACGASAAVAGLWLPGGPALWAGAGALAGAVLSLAALAVARLPWPTEPGLHLLRRPRPRWAGVAALGFVVVATAVLVVIHGEYELGQRSAQWAVAMDLKPPELRPVVAEARTDRGRHVGLYEPAQRRAPAELAGMEKQLFGGRDGPDRAIRTGPAGDETNCHGWLFAAGRYYVRGSEVEWILQDNGYTPAAPPQPGDLAIYRIHGAIVHSALVRYVSTDQPVLVEGKWGWAGVYLHLAGESSFGSDVTYFRSPRASHSLAGFEKQLTARGTTAEE
jgi:hypothetical protein